MKRREIVVANTVSIILGLLTFSLLIILVSMFGVSANTPIVFCIALFFFSIPFLNRIGYVTISRVLLGVVPPILVLVSIIVSRRADPTASDISFYDGRLYLVLCSIVPCLIFEDRERRPLYGTLSIILASLVLFDPIHNFFQIGYYQSGFTGKSYYYINYAAILTMAGIVAGAIGLRRIIRKAENETRTAMVELARANNDLEAQNEEIQTQREELVASEESLREANRTIESHNSRLQKEVIDINEELKNANQVLIKQNNELLQFSYTISHNLRGPIARLLGLTNLVEINTLDDRQHLELVANHIKTSAEELDSVIKDLAMILETRNSFIHERQRIDLEELWHTVITLIDIDDDIKPNIKNDFKSNPTIISIRPYVHSILLNLVTNSIKYSAPDRPLMITANSKREGRHTVISIIDNGLGIDLEAFKADIFRMYKRFHLHKEGKGLGLYLVKTQVELLGGSVSVESTPDKGSTFKIFLRDS